MSEHPELREEMAAVLANQPLWSSGGADADALLALPAGPVGKLQAENERLSQRRYELLHEIAALRAQLADPEHIRREAIGAWVQTAAEDRPGKAYGLGATYSNAWTDGYNDALDAALAAGESAVTGEAT